MGKIIISMMDMCLFLACILLISSVISNWKIFEKAGVARWKSLIPIYSSYCSFELASGHGWCVLFLLIPGVNTIVSALHDYKLAKAFGHNLGFTLGLVLMPFTFHLILAFGKSEYIGPQ